MEGLKGKTFYFNADMAMLLGVEKAVLVHNICYWTEVNQANGVNYHDGRYWTFNTSEAFTKLFPFWSLDKIKRMLKDLEQEGHLLTGVYNKLKFDRTKWYSPSDGIVAIYNCKVQNNTLHCAKMHNDIVQNRTISLGENAQPIPNINTDVNPNVNKNINKGASAIVADYTSDAELADALNGLLEVRKAKKTPNTDRAVKLLLTKLDKLTDFTWEKVMIVNQSVERGWASVFPLKDDKGGAGGGDSQGTVHNRFTDIMRERGITPID